MPQTPDNLDPKEATEARLCAYLEGEMAPDERAEIEKYLQSNPQHRQLLADLAKTRTLIASLPRESAPPDIAEAFQSQLERSMLLDGTGSSEPAAGVNRLPQMVLAAAIVVLAAGLGVVVYFTLPGSPPPKLTAYVPIPQAATVPATTNLTVAVPTASPLAVTVKEKQPSPPTEVASNKPLISQAAGEMAEQSEPLNHLAAKAAPATQSTLKALQNQIARTDDHVFLMARTLRIVVSADDPSSAAREIQENLAANHIAFESHLSGNGQGGPLAKSGETSQLSMNALKDQARDQQQLAESQPQNMTFRQQTATQPVVLASQEIFIAHGLTASQAERIRQNLSAQHAGWTVQVHDPADEMVSFHTAITTRPTAAPAATTAPTTMPLDLIAKDDRLTVTVDQLVGPGMDKTNLVQVSDDGTINLPMLIEPVHAAGLTPLLLAKQIAAKYSEAHLIPNATVQVDRIATVEGPAKTAEITAATQSLIAATQPATKPAAFPTTVPTPANVENIDLVILVQKHIAPATEPATQPTTAPALAQ